VADSPRLPGQHGWKDAQGRPLPVEFFRFLRDLLRYIQSTTGVVADLGQLEQRIAALEAEGAQSGEIVGPASVRAFGQLPGQVVLQLDGDQTLPGATTVYGRLGAGARGWFALGDAFVEGTGIAITADGTTGIVTVALDDLTDDGTGALLAITRDTQGRLSGTRAPTADDFASLNWLDLTDAADDAAAAVAGVSLGGLYRTGGAPRIRET
jgi:hypothetical protein